MRPHVERQEVGARRDGIGDQRVRIRVEQHQRRIARKFPQRVAPQMPARALAADIRERQPFGPLAIPRLAQQRPDRGAGPRGTQGIMIEVVETLLLQISRHAGVDRGQLLPARFVARKPRHNILRETRTAQHAQDLFTRPQSVEYCEPGAIEVAADRCRIARHQPVL